jgi:hypothetical protein
MKIRRMGAELSHAHRRTDMTLIVAFRNATPRPLYPEKDPVPIVWEAVLAPGPVWTGAENLAYIGIRTPDRSAP